jgi:diacylglycerol kinase (ATP)
MATRERFSWSARARSFGNALRGIAQTLAEEHNARIHALATVAVCGLGLLLGLEALAWCALILAMAVVWVAELLNTALEALCDANAPDAHPLVAKAKDAAAAAVLAAAIGAAVVGGIVLGPPLLRAIG